MRARLSLWRPSRRTVRGMAFNVPPPVDRDFVRAQAEARHQREAERFKGSGLGAWFAALLARVRRKQP